MTAGVGIFGVDGSGESPNRADEERTVGLGGAPQLFDVPFQVIAHAVEIGRHVGDFDRRHALERNPAVEVAGGDFVAGFSEALDGQTEPAGSEDGKSQGQGHGQRGGHADIPDQVFDLPEGFIARFVGHHSPAGLLHLPNTSKQRGGFAAHLDVDFGGGARRQGHPVFDQLGLEQRVIDVLAIAAAPQKAAASVDQKEVIDLEGLAFSARAARQNQAHQRLHDQDVLAHFERHRDGDCGVAVLRQHGESVLRLQGAQGGVVSLGQGPIGGFVRLASPVQSPAVLVEGIEGDKIRVIDQLAQELADPRFLQATLERGETRSGDQAVAGLFELAAATPKVGGKAVDEDLGRMGEQLGFFALEDLAIAADEVEGRHQQRHDARDQHQEEEQLLQLEPPRLRRSGGETTVGLGGFAQDGRIISERSRGIAAIWYLSTSVPDVFHQFGHSERFAWPRRCHFGQYPTSLLLPVKDR